MSRGRAVVRWVAAVACAVLGSLAANAKVGPGWTLVDLGTLGGPGSYGAAVTNSGLVVGCADVDANSAHAFIYRDGVMHDLGTGTDSAGGHSCALAVNNLGVAAGRSATGELVIWNHSNVTHLGVQGNVGGINDRGVVVGSFVQGASTRAFFYSHGVVTPFASETSSEASAINFRGEIAGTSDDRAFVYRHGALVDLGTLGGNRSDANGLNDRGEVVGMSTDANGQPLSFLYDRVMQALPAPGYSSAAAINNRGQIVGSAEGISGYLIDGGNFVRLSTLPAVTAKGWRRLEPTGINDRGWIVGTGTDPDGNLRAFLLIPGATQIAIKHNDDRIAPGSRR
jgi:probable HAF family extracellular repeat protein